MTEKWQTKDFILVAVLSVVFSMLFAVAGISTAIFGGVTHVFAPAIIGFFGSIVFLLMLVKVPKKGIFALSSFVIIAMMFLTGHTFLPQLISIFLGALIADLISYPTKYKNFYALATGYIVFMNSMALGTIVSIMVFLDDYTRYIADKGEPKRLESSSKIVEFLTLQNALLLILVTTIACVIGLFIAKGLLRKHFEKAGKLN